MTLDPLTSHVKYSAEECRRVAELARTLNPILGDPNAIAERARIFQALGNETRLQILGLLSVRETCVCNIVKVLGGAASTIAHHLRMLEDAGLITAKQDGKFTIYALNEAILIKHRVFEVNV